MWAFYNNKVPSNFAASPDKSNEPLSDLNALQMHLIIPYSIQSLKLSFSLDKDNERNS